MIKKQYLFPLILTVSCAILLGACAPGAVETATLASGATQPATSQPPTSAPTAVPPTFVPTTAAPTSLPPTVAPTLNIPATGSGTTVASTPGTPAGPVVVGDNTVITLADDGATVTMQVGQRFLLQLGETYTWEVTPTDQSVLSRVIGITVIRGAQGIYEARQAGTTTLSAEGTPACTTNKSGCTPSTTSREFKVTVVVK